jgi:hypothetical protein
MVSIACSGILIFLSHGDFWLSGHANITFFCRRIGSLLTGDCKPDRVGIRRAPRKAAAG